MKKIFTLWVSFVLSGMIQSQAQNITTINYNLLSLSAADCNTLNSNPLRIIDNITHVPVCGGLKYRLTQPNLSNGRLMMPTRGGVLASNKSGTA